VRASRPIETRHYRAFVADDEVPGLLTRYRAVLVEMHAQRIETGRTPRNWNRLVDRMQRLHLELRETPGGRAGITDCALNGENDTVRDWQRMRWRGTRKSSDLCSKRGQ
jgi:hypothetical protein